MGTESLCWRFFRYVGDFCIKSVTNISNLSPTDFVSNIRHHHRCKSHHVTALNVPSFVYGFKSELRNNAAKNKARTSLNWMDESIYNELVYDDNSSLNGSSMMGSGLDVIPSQMLPQAPIVKIIPPVNGGPFMEPPMTNQSMNQPGNYYNQNWWARSRARYGSFGRPGPYGRLGPFGRPGPLEKPGRQGHSNKPGQKQSGNKIGMNPNWDGSTNQTDKKKMIQNQLIILIHAAKCKIRGDQNEVSYTR